MTDPIDIRNDALPDAMRILLDQYPRDGWQAHPNFALATQNWLGAHRMFRRLGEITRVDTERFLDRKKPAKEYASRLSYYGDLLARNLHGHHSWEDRYYFPEISAADRRFDMGIKILENDHQVLDKALDQFTNFANRVIQLIQLDEHNARDDAGPLHDNISAIERLLDRHLGDEEELVVPIILHHKLR